MSYLKHNEKTYGRRSPLIIIEHLENHFSLWIRAEYKHSKRIAGDRLVFTNLQNFLEEAEKQGLCPPCFSASIINLRGVLYTNPRRVIILDPLADKVLEPEEARKAEAIVVGGILGDNPPRGRTHQLLTSKAKLMQPRSLGPYQLSIDGAVYLALKAVEGISPKDVPLIHKPRLSFSIGDLEFEIELPFSYPLVKGKPLISEEVKRLLLSGLGYEEYQEFSQLEYRA